MDPLSWTWLIFTLSFLFVFLSHSQTVYNCLPSLLKDVTVYGKLLDPRKRTKIQQFLLVPKRWFVHFYILSFIWNGFILMNVVQCILNGSALPIWYSKMLSWMTRYPVSPPSVYLLTVLIAMAVMVVHAHRRIYECLAVSVYSNSSIHVSHYITGIVFYSLLGISVMAEGPNLSLEGESIQLLHLLEDLQWHHIAGLLMFVWASWHHHTAHVIFASLRTTKKGKPNSMMQNNHSSSSASDDDEKTKKKPDKSLSGKADGNKLSKMKVHPAIATTQNGGMRSRKTKTLQRHTTERDWLREKFPNRRDKLRSEEARVLRKCYSCEESVVLSAKPRVTKSRCQSDSGMSRRLMSRSSSVEEGERGGTMWDGFLQVFPATFSPTSSFRSEDDMLQGDGNSVFGDDDDDIDDDTKNQWCIINKDGSMGFYDNGHKNTVNGQAMRNRQSRSHLMLNGTGSCDSILPKHSKFPRNLKKRTSPLLSSQSLDERDFERTSSPRTSSEKNGAHRRNLSSFSHNSEGAIDVKNLRGGDLKTSTWSSDTSGFVSNGSVNGECSEATKKLLNWRKQQLKLNLRSNETKERGFNPLNGVITKSLELLFKSEGKTSKKPVVGLNFTSAKGEIFKPFKRRSRLSQSGSERDLESSFDSVSSSDESLTTYPINPTKQSQLNKEQNPKPEMPIRSNSLSMLEKLMPKDFKFPESPLVLSRKPSSESLSLNQEHPLEPHDPGRHTRNAIDAKCEFRKRRPASNPNLRCIHQQERHQSDNLSLGQGQKEEDKTNTKNPMDASLYLRYYHVFKEGELTDLIERNVENLHIIKSYYDHANWCVVAEKVEVWRI